VDDESRFGALGADAYFDQGASTFPFGAHIAVVEVDTETGEVRLVRHVAVDDCGTVLNPLLVEGQQHGGIASGVGQALYEEVRFDSDGNPITSNLADYAVPSAAELPMFDARSTETPTPLNPLGAKGIGEASTIGSTPAVQNAVIDALAHLGVRHIDMPCTSERVWAAIRDARNGTLADPWREPPAVFARASVADGPDEASIDAAEGI
jgi:carbon-monoxide dehydrogenase large subunit